jgi:hypothetical protein
MYRLSSTVSFYNNRRFNGMVEAVKEAQRLYKGGYTEIIDVLYDIDNHYYRVVWSCEKRLIGKRVWKGKWEDRTITMESMKIG